MSTLPSLSESQGRPGGRPPLSRRAKAAIIVQFLLNEEADVPLSALPDDLQAELTLQLGRMRYIDRATLNAVVEEFSAELDGIGLSFPGDMAGALSALDGKISARTAARLRKEAGVRQSGDPWERIGTLPEARIAELASAEAIEVAAVMLSKINTAKAAAVLALMPGEQARRITYAVSMTAGVSPEAVDRIGLSLAAQLDAEPPKAFANRADERVGAILNYAASAKRDEVLEGLEETDKDFAEAVRRAIFTFADIPTRLKKVDVPKITRDVPPEVLTTAIAAATSEADLPAAEFLLENMSKRMAGALREDAAGMTVKGKKGETAMSTVVTAIRELVAVGEIELRTGEDDED
ncbi:flagellar motor switch protein FliG [Salipiger sp. PrR002]|uniref:flagellar motor switch protein FliG n=1 Tax=Salipiger sp. PrR002 TaxID=2706489 RepID=UPI0013B8A12B|nr:FliG C-terminal domain-containing protein [Salipiger sp. PrR002]NDV98111.1 flagellar motor switch protein FliG [Salipiger sp. PrR002]NDW57086.1 flagellar motor switch protein FliG [Salipiger sp. PrR004]